MWGCPVYVIDDQFQNPNMPGWSNLDPHACAGIYFRQSPLRSILVTLEIYPSIGNLSPQYYGLFDDNFLTVIFMWEGSTN